MKNEKNKSRKDKFSDQPKNNQEQCAYCKKIATTTDAMGIPSCIEHQHKADKYAEENGYRNSFSKKYSG